MNKKDRKDGKVANAQDTSPSCNEIHGREPELLPSERAAGVQWTAPEWPFS
jgi:hypothetical protein